MEPLKNSTRNLATTKPNAVQSGEISFDTALASPTPECALCRQWLTTEPWMNPDYVPVEEILPSVTQEIGRKPFNLFTDSAKSGCRGCEVLVEGASLYAHSIGHKDPDSIMFKQNLRLYAKLFWEDEDTRVLIQTGRDRSQFEYFIPFGVEMLQAWKGLQPSEQLEPDPRSAERMATLKLLVEVCNKIHTGPCQVERQAQLPARVIDLGASDDIIKDVVYLREPMPEENDYYIALSHCWGELPITRTLKDNLDDMKKGIRMDSLPQTFQDAILLTRWFNVRYLWIDSLCIIQDDTDDWKREASKMADVYGNSYFTIAASAAKDGSVGCLVPRTIPAARSFKRDLSLFGSDYGKIEVSVRQRLHQQGDAKSFLGKDLKNKDQAPLEERAWTFQESLLRDASYSSTAMKSFSNVNRQPSQLVIPEDSASDLSDRWRSFVEQYSGRNITYLIDRLPALAGVASRFCNVAGGYYVAGMWKHSILDDLQWHTVAESPANRSHGGEGNYFPSWSWLSTSARVAWHSRGTVVPGEKYMQINEATIHMVDTLIDKDFPLGQSPGAILLMEGFALPATIRYVSPAKAQASRGNSSAYVWPDYDYSKAGPDQVKDGSEVLLFLMCQQYTSPYFENSMLVLRENFAAGTEYAADGPLYERIGYARNLIFNVLFNPGEENPDFNFRGNHQKVSMIGPSKIRGSPRMTA